MTYESEIKELKKIYKEKIEQFNLKKNKTVGRDTKGNEEHKIDVCFLEEINKLKKKYNKI